MLPLPVKTPKAVATAGEYECDTALPVYRSARPHDLAYALADTLSRPLLSTLLSPSPVWMPTAVAFANEFRMVYAPPPVSASAFPYTSAYAFAITLTVPSLSMSFTPAPLDMPAAEAVAWATMGYFSLPVRPSPSNTCPFASDQTIPCGLAITSIWPLLRTRFVPLPVTMPEALAAA